METVILIVSYVLMIAPTWVEALVIDPKLYWDKGLSDKPGSTILRAVMFATACIQVDLVFYYAPWYYALAVCVSHHVLLFALLINKVRGMPMDYLSDKGMDKYLKVIPFEYRLIIGEILLIASIILLETHKY